MTAWPFDEARDDGRTVFLSSHVLSEVERVADRVGILKDGHLTAVEEVGVLKERAAHRLEARLAAPVPADTFDGVAGVRQAIVEGRFGHLRCRRR